MNLKRTRIPRLAFCLTAAILTPACDTMTVPPPEAVLAGTWDLETDQDFGLTRKTFEFDSVGRITEIRTVTAGFITVTERDIVQDVDVAGDDVRIETGDNFVFTGVFNADQTTITGKLTTEFEFFSTTITIDNGDAVMTRQ